MDAGYLKCQVGVPLRQCLSEVAEKRPYDPIEFIAHWLYKYVENQKYEEKKKAEAVQLIQERKEYEIEMARRERMRQEAERLAVIEAEKRREEEERRAREADSASKLATVEEGQEPAGEQLPSIEGEGEERPAEEGEAPMVVLPDEEAPAEAAPAGEGEGAEDA